MRNTTDDEFDNMSYADVVKKLGMLNEIKEEESLSVMRERLKKMERTRYLMVWLDLSTVANQCNHSHLHVVFMVSCLYDPSTFYSDSEYEEITGEKVSIQAQVEAPQLHIIARSSSTVEEQLCYVETRTDCLQELSNPLANKSGIEFVDMMRFFHGDSPARQFECGQQKGGNYYCSLCKASAKRVYELDYSFHCAHLSLADRQELVLKGALGRKNSLAKLRKPLKGLNKESLIAELSSRGIYQGDNKRELDELLTEEMHGVQRVPALLFNKPTGDLESINCSQYEILGFEPLYDIGKHIENVFTELPAHLPTAKASELKAAIELSIGSKETKRTFDYRCALIMITNQIRGKVNSKVQMLLDTLVEIQEIAYSLDAHRTPRSVLRLHNLTWYHAMLCRKLIGFSLKHLTTRKFYGNYFHNITSHAAIQNRLVSGRSANAEEEERVFDTITNITRTTTSYHASHITGNICIRLQVEKKMHVYQNPHICKQETHISKLASSLPSFSNTIIPKEMIVNHSRVWQSHLERISDFLLAGKGAWWKTCKNGSIEFFDSKGCPEIQPKGPVLHHFRSSTFKAEEAYLKDCWKMCLQCKPLIPVTTLRIEDDKGNQVIENLGLGIHGIYQVDVDENAMVSCVDVEEEAMQIVATSHMDVDGVGECVNEDVVGMY